MVINVIMKSFCPCSKCFDNFSQLINVLTTFPPTDSVEALLVQT